MDRRQWLQALFAGAVSPAADSFGDGTPDFLRLRSRADQLAFRNWFTFLAEIQFFREPGGLPKEISDCSALLRHAYRESFRRHDSEWLREMGLETVPPLPSVRAWAYPHPALGAAIFRVRPGPWASSDSRNGSFRQFADAQTLMRCNCHRTGDDLRRAEPGDLLFYRQLDDYLPFHSMIFIGGGWFEQPGPAVVYHTGPTSGRAGEMRRLTVDELLRHREPRWRPLPGNANFLGLYRWNVLRDPA